MSTEFTPRRDVEDDDLTLAWPRTLLAWHRTALALAGFSFVLVESLRDGGAEAVRWGFGAAGSLLAVGAMVLARRRFGEDARVTTRVDDPEVFFRWLTLGAAALGIGASVLVEVNW